MGFTYNWNLKDLSKIEKNNLNVFSTFSCGGGSTMGYKMSGCNVIAANDIDKRMMEVYKLNFNPKYYFLCPIKDLIQKSKNKELPEELYNLDILDGSPPCSTFSVAGIREAGWKIKKKFTEGQAEQNLSDLFFDYINLVNELKPKIFIAENVKGMLIGNAKAYTKLILKEFNNAGYNVQLFLLNGKNMGLPQARERVFFIGQRKDLKFKKLTLNFNERNIFFKEIHDFSDKTENITDLEKEYWTRAKPGGSIGKFKSNKKLNLDKVAGTIASGTGYFSPIYKRKLNLKELSALGSWPQDYKFITKNYQYLIGMSVPPMMMYKITEQIKKQIYSI